MNRIKLAFLKLFVCKTNPVKYLRALGVSVGERTLVYNKNPNIVTTEPQLISIGNDCVITGGVRFLSHDMSPWILKDEKCHNFTVLGNIEIGDNVFIGANTIILPGVKIGNNTIIGAGSVVTKSFEGDVVIGGNPARVICNIEQFENKVRNIMDGNNPRYYKDTKMVYGK